MKKTVLITGGSKGIGKSIVKKFAMQNYNIIFTYLTSEKLAKSLKEQIENEFKVDVFIQKVDIQKESEIVKLVNDSIFKFGAIDCLINNAAISHDNYIEDKTESEFKDVLNTNLIGPFLTMKHIGKRMKSQGSGTIINISSTNGIDTQRNYSIDYDASKSGLISLTHSFAAHLAPNVRVNAVCPGWTTTETVETMNPNDLKLEKEKILMERFAHPEEIANVVYFISSEEASYINNSIIRVDGGIKN